MEPLNLTWSVTVLECDHIEIEKQLTELSQLPIETVRYLDFSQNILNGDCAIKFADLLKRVASLETLVFVFNNIEEEADTLIAAFGNLSTLKVLDFTAWPGKETSLFAGTLGKLKNLRELHLHNLYPEGAEKVAPALEQLNNIRVLSLKENRLGKEGIEFLSKGISQMAFLEVLDLSFNQLEDKGAVNLAKTLETPHSLKNLSIRGNGIGDEGAMALAGALLRNPDLEFVDISNNSIKTKGSIALSKALKKMKKLKSLNLELNSIGSEGTIAVAKSLRNHGQLQYLILSINGIDDEGALSLIEPLRRVESLISIALENNSISDSVQGILYNVFGQIVSPPPTQSFLEIERKPMDLP